jgi:hypothetical protein
VKGFCVLDALQRDEDAGAGGGDGGVGGDDPSDGACSESGETDFCYEGDAETSTRGRCRAGNRLCADGTWGPCLGQVLPREEICNGDDDDCDGEVDEELVLGSCQTGQMGVCDTGVISCESGVAFCVSELGASAEVCDGDDNDCDGDTDEETDGPCFPAGMTGCTVLDEGGYDCAGICAAGMQRCVDGVLEACEDFVGPMTEQCNTGGTAADEDCDGETDEICTCDPGDTQPCYSGPEGTEGRGICEAGEQACVDGFFGDCMNETMPGSESCLNEDADDDCNGVRDDIPGRGQPCNLPSGSSGAGICRDGTLGCSANADSGLLVCVPREPTPEQCNGIDDDCNNGIDEDFQNDPEQCGSDCEPCDDGQACCDGECITTRNNDAHCGGCGRDCGSGLTCCGTGCVDLDTNPQHCGECGNLCPTVGPSGERCCVEGRCKESGDLVGSDDCGTVIGLPGSGF